jgi:hypothetical protein
MHHPCPRGMTNMRSTCLTRTGQVGLTRLLGASRSAVGLRAEARPFASSALAQASDMRTAVHPSTSLPLLSVAVRVARLHAGWSVLRVQASDGMQLPVSPPELRAETVIMCMALAHKRHKSSP